MKNQIQLNAYKIFWAISNTRKPIQVHGIDKHAIIENLKTKTRQKGYSCLVITDKQFGMIKISDYSKGVQFSDAVKVATSKQIEEMIYISK